MGKTIFSYFVYSFLLLTLLSSFSFISATTLNTNLPDICLQEGEGSYPADFPLEYNLSEYITFHVDDVCYLRVRDPDEVGYLDLPDGHMSLWAECYEASYYFKYGHDTMNFMSYSDGGCYLPSGTYDNNFWCCQEGNCGDKFFSNDFTINVSNSCDPVTNESGGGDPSTLTSSLIAYYDLNEVNGTVLDSVGTYDGTNDGASPQFSGKDSTSYHLNAGNTDDITLGSNAITSLLMDTDFSVSFWIYTNASSGRIIGHNLNSHNDRFRISLTSGPIGWASYSNDHGSHTLYRTNQKILSDNWVHVVAVYDGDGASPVIDFYINGTDQSYLAGETTSGVGEVGYTLIGSYNQANYYNGRIDEVSFYNKTLNSTEVDFLYNAGAGRFYDDITNASSGGGTPPTHDANISDVTLGNSANTSVNITAHFTNYSTLLVTVPDPINPFIYSLYAGYGTLNGDYYELDNYGTNITLFSYDRPYNFTVNVSACNPGPACVEDSFDVWVNATLSGVELLQSFPSPVCLDTVCSETGKTEVYSANSYFRYYDSVVFVYNESNYSGILNSSFPWSYTSISNGQNGVNYTVTVNCTIGGTDTDYNILGDLNITLECNEFNAFYTLASYNNYNQTVLFNATNTVNSTWGSFLLYAGNPQYPAGFIPPLTSGSAQWWTDGSEAFAEVFGDPDVIGQDIATKIVILTLVVATVGVFFAFFVFLPFNAILFIIMAVDTFLLFFFANIGYVSSSTVFIVATIFVIFSAIKLMLKGK